MRRTQVLSLALVFAVAANLSGAQGASPVGPEFVVSSNESSACHIAFSSAAGLKGGGFVVIWQGCDPYDIVVGQLYSTRGKRVGDEFRVAYYFGDRANPSVARLTDGGFVVTWQSSKFADIYSQRYNAAGQRVGGKFRVNSSTKTDQSWPAVARLTDGGFVVTWQSRQDGKPNVYAQRYNSTGERAGREFRVNTYTENYQWEADVAGLTDGGFVVTWRSFEQDGSGDGLYGQRYRASGEPVGGEFRINSHTKRTQSFGKVAALKDGGFVVTWYSYRQDGEDYGVYGQRYTARGEPVGDEFRVNTYTAGSQDSASVAGLKDGGFVVTWRSSDKRDGNHSGIYGQQYDASGERAGREFLIAKKPHQRWGFVYEPSVAGLESGGFIVTWTKRDRHESIYGRLYDAE